MVWLAGCNRAGLTPLEQKPLETLEGPRDFAIYLAVQEAPVEVEPLVRVAREFERHRLEIAVVWQMRQAPSTEMLARFAGKSFRQYWDPKGLVPGTGAWLVVRGQRVALGEVPLRVALARATLTGAVSH